MVSKEKNSLNTAGTKRRRDHRRAGIWSFVVSLMVLGLLNVLGSYFFTRIDLTSEKRYTLSGATRDILRELDDVVYFRVYLEGDFPSGFKRLSRSTQETLDEFRAWTGNIEYEFINPSASADAGERNDIHRQLMEKGLEPTTLQVRQSDGSEQRIIFPGAIASYKGREFVVQLLKSQTGMAPEQSLNGSIQDLEYNLASAIRRLAAPVSQSVGILEGHGELADVWLWDAMTALSENYKLERVSLDEKIYSLTEREYVDDSTTLRIRNRYTALIVAKPDSAFSERDKFILDQYIMRGGKVLWLLDRTNADMDSLQARPETVGISHNINLDDMLFRYGARINPDLLMDIRSMPIPVKTGDIGGQPQFEFYPWYFMPLVGPASNHPVVANLNMVKTEFVSSIDSIETQGIRKVPLLQTSRYTRTVATPAYVSLEVLKEEPKEEMFAQGPRIVAMLLEGSFPSLFANRIPPEIADDPEIGFLERSEPTSMIIIADGDVITNQVSAGTRQPLPLGYDQYTGETFGNRDLLLNAMNYLCDGSGLINIRAREINMRLLDRPRLSRQRVQWQVINTVLPVVLISLFGLAGHWLRRRKYARTH